MQLTAGPVYCRHAGYAGACSANRLAGRLLFLQHYGLLHLQAAGGLPALQTILEGLECNPAWQELRAAASTEQARLRALLPPDLRHATARRQRAAEIMEDNE
ncbi:hypothetical protein ABPG77_009842 [Micractinium sp. CCAP 211/92]